MEKTIKRRDAIFKFMRGLMGAERGGAAGFTLVEVVIAAGIALVIAGAIYTIYNSFYRQTTIQDLVLESQQNARVGMSLIERELQNAGYAAGTADIVTEATATSVEFVYTDPATVSSMTSLTAGKKLKVAYRLCDPASGTYSALVAAAKCPAGMTYAALIRSVTNLTDGAPMVTNELIPNTKTLSITYFNTNGVAIVAADQATRNTIRFVDMVVTSETSRLGPGDVTKRTFLMEMHVHLRNVEMGQTILDTQPPDAPLGPGGGSIQVRDSGKCGRLQVGFQKSVAPDVVGYKIYYGTDSSGIFSGYLTIPNTVLTSSEYSCTNVGSNYSCTIAPQSPTHAPLLYTGSFSPSVTPVYYIAIKSYDSSLNESPLSAMSYGDVSTADITSSSRVLGAGVNDSTINPQKPGAVTGLTGSQPVNASGVTIEGQVQLNWTQYDMTANPDVTELRVYRNTVPFTTFPINPSYLVAQVSPMTTTYVDTATSLRGCQVYYYAVAPVNCDTDLILNNTGTDTIDRYYDTLMYAKTYGDGAAKPGVDSPAGSNTTPADTTPPATPTLQKRNGVIVSGYKRTFIDFLNPIDQDFDHTDLYYNTVTYPAVDTTYGSATYGVISGGLAVPNTDNVSMGVKGRFYSTGQTISFVHDTDNTGAIQDINTIKTPTLAGAQYYYLAVAYDKCGNPSTSTGNATSLATLCGDGVDASDPENGPPESPTGVTVSGCYPRYQHYNWQTAYTNPPAGQGTGLTVSWNPVTSTASRNPDLAGYRIYRTSTYTTTGTPLFNTAVESWSVTPTAVQSGIPCSSNPWTTCYLGFVPVGATTQYVDNNLTSLTNWQGYNWTYGVVATDCVFENRFVPNLTGADGITPDTFKYNTSDRPNTHGLSSGWKTFNGLTGEGANPGLIDRDEKYPYFYQSLLSPYTSWSVIGPTLWYPDGQREVLTGVTISNSAADATGTGVTKPNTTYTHDNVMMFIGNFANNKQTISSVELQWMNSGAYLNSVSLGGGFGLTDYVTYQDTSVTPNAYYYNQDWTGNGSQGARVTQSVPITSTIAGTAPYSSAATVGLPVLQLEKYRRNIPLNFKFTDAAGAPIDMRGDTVLVKINYKNDATGTTSCVSYPTINRDYAGIFVPYGPSITSIVQDKPTSPTSGYPIYSDVTVFGGGVVNNVLPTDGTLNSAATVTGQALTVTITMTVASGTDDLSTGGKINLDKAILYYTDTDVTVGTPPSSFPYAGTVTQTAPASTTMGTVPFSMPKPAGATGTGSTNRRVWYYIVAYDKEGNWERSPVNGAYTFDWKSFDVCDVTPSAPVSLMSPTATDTMSDGTSSFTYTAGSATYNVIRWPRVTTYTNGTTITLSADPIKYNIYRRDTTSGAYSLVGSFLDSATTGNSWAATAVAPAPFAPATASAYVINQTGDTGYAEWRDVIASATNDSTYYVTVQNSCTTAVKESTNSPQYRECVGATNGVINITPATATNPATPMTSGTPITVSVLDCPLGSTVPNNNIQNQVSISITNTTPRASLGYEQQITETAKDTGLFYKDATAPLSVATVITAPGDTSTGIYVRPTNAADDNVTIQCTKLDGSAGGCSGITAPVKLYVTAATCDNRPSNFTVAPTAKTNKNKLTGCGSISTLSGAGADGVDLTWTTVAGDKDPITGYEVYRKLSTAGTWTLLATCGAAETKFSDRALTNTTAGYYYYYVVPRDGCTSGEQADAVAPTGTSANPAGVGVMKCPAVTTNNGACTLALP